jgi:hypothetical protein
LQASSAAPDHHDLARVRDRVPAARDRRRAGANARHSIGTGIIGGMLGETTLAMLYVPLFFYIFDRSRNEERRRKRKWSRRRRSRSNRPPPRRAAQPLQRHRPRRIRVTRGWMMRGQRNRGALLALVVALCIVVSGCVLGPDYSRPAVDAPAAFRFEPKAVAETANTEWWKQFGDPVLDQLIATALATISTSGRRSQRRAGCGVFTQTRSGLFPQIGYGGTGNGCE